MKTLTKVSDKLCNIVSYFSMAACAAIMCLMAADVLLRHLFNRPITGAYEITTMIMTILIFSSWSYTQTIHGHVHVTMFLGMMPQKLRFLLFGVTSLFSTIIIGLATYASYIHTFELIEDNTSTGTLLIPHWPFMGLECIALFLFTLVLLLDTVKAFMAMFSKEYATEVQSYWS
jgi:TRAP-type C4-dicarboxylate transport system permease small subunit